MMYNYGMKIGLFGGSFDPPHSGHLKIANTLIAKKYCDVIWFVPCAQHPYQKDISSASHRFAMLKTFKNFSICAYELNKNSTSYSVETLEYFQKLFPNDTFIWIIGSDQLADFKKWYRYEDILKNFQVLVYPRTGFPFDNMLPGIMKLEHVENIDISSSQIKNLLQEKKSIESHTTPEIIKYIKNNELYQ